MFTAALVLVNPRISKSYGQGIDPSLLHHRGIERADSVRFGPIPDNTTVIFVIAVTKIIVERSLDVKKSRLIDVLEKSPHSENEE